MTLDKDQKGFLSEILEDLEEKYKAPTPETISLKTAKFESLLSGWILPFIGLNGFIIGNLYLNYLLPEYSVILSIISAISGIAVLSWLYFSGRIKDEWSSMFVSGAFSFIILALLSIHTSVLTGLLALIVIHLLIYLVYTQKLGEKSIPLFVIYIPILLFSLRADEHLERLILEGFSLVPMLGLFLSKRMRLAGFTTVISVVITGGIELQKQGGGVLPLTLLLFIFLAVAILYELRIPAVEYSNFRYFIGHGLIILLLYYVVSGIREPNTSITVWIWAALASGYQAFRLYREKVISPSRVSWIAISLSVALWVSETSLQWHAQAFGNLALAATLQLTAIKSEKKFLSGVAILMVVFTALISLPKSSEDFSLSVQIVGLLTLINLIFLSKSPRFPASLPWWAGFIKVEHIGYLKKFLLVGFGVLFRVPIFTMLFSWIRTLVMWLKYFKADGGPLGVNDLLFIAANLYAVLILTNQFSIYLKEIDVSWMNNELFIIMIWAVWGLGLVLLGSRRNLVFPRIIGIGFMLVPLLHAALDWTSDDYILIAGLCVIIGFVFWMTGMIIKRPIR